MRTGSSFSGEGRSRRSTAPPARPAETGGRSGPNEERWRASRALGERGLGRDDGGDRGQAGGTTLVIFNDVQRQRSKAKSSNAKRFRPVKVTVVAQLSKTATAGSLPAAIAATLCGGPVASVDVRGPLFLVIGWGFVTLLL